MRKLIFDKIARVMMVAMMATVCMTFMTACGGSDDDPLENNNPVNNGGNGQTSRNGLVYPNLWTAFGASYNTVVEYAKSNGFNVEQEVSSLEYVYLSNADGSITLIYHFDWNGDVSKMKRLYVYWAETTLADAEWIKGEVEKAFKVTLEGDYDFETVNMNAWSHIDRNMSLVLTYVPESRVTMLMLYGGM